MKITYNRKSVPYISGLLFIILTEVHFFGVVSFPPIIDFIVYTNRTKWIAFISVVWGIICWDNHKKDCLKKYIGFLNHYLFVVFFSVVIHYIYSTIKYPANQLITTYGLGAPYLYVFMTIPLLYLFELQSGPQKLLKSINIITAILYIISIIQGFYYIRTGGVLFGDSNISTLLIRNNKVRYSAGPFANVMILYNFYLLYVNKNEKFQKKLWPIFVLLLLALNIYFTGQTRVVILSIIFNIFVLIILSNKSKKHRYIIIVYILLVFIGLIIYGLPYKVLQSFSINSVNAGSTIARLNAFKYYFMQFLKNPLFAISFAGDENYYNLVHGNSGIYYQSVLIRYYYSDCGFVGQLAKLGIFVVFVYIWPLIRFFKIAKKLIKSRLVKPGAFLASLVGYLFITSITLIVLDKGRIILWPIIIAIFEYYYQHLIVNFKK
jgi:hypothetical protein